MSLILHIETAVETASICIAKHGEFLAIVSNPEQKDHAAWIHQATRGLIQDAGYTLKDLSAIAVSAGPGSYTGLRVGMASAKGLSYALQIPLISLNTLEIMAVGALKSMAEKKETKKYLLVPMIDARRMEVFTAIYNEQLKNILAPQAMVLDVESFDTWLQDQPLIFFGNGHEKLKNLVHHPNAIFEELIFSAKDMVSIAYSYFQDKIFADLAYSEPYYTKGFYSPAKKS